jgi:hypothetical protein
MVPGASAVRRRSEGARRRRRRARRPGPDDRAVPGRVRARRALAPADLYRGTAAGFVRRRGGRSRVDHHHHDNGPDRFEPARGLVRAARRGPDVDHDDRPGRGAVDHVDVDVDLAADDDHRTADNDHRTADDDVVHHDNLVHHDNGAVHDGAGDDGAADDNVVHHDNLVHHHGAAYNGAGDDSATSDDRAGND